MPANWENSAVATGLEKTSFHSDPKERKCQRIFKLPHNCTHLTPQQSNAQNSPSQASQYIYCELPDVQAGFRKGRGTRDQIANIRQIIEKTREFQKHIYFCFIDYAKAFNCGNSNKLWKILKVLGIPNHLTCLLRNVYAGQEASVRTGHETTDCFQIGKGVCQGCILSPCLFIPRVTTHLRQFLRCSSRPHCSPDHSLQPLQGLHFYRPFFCDSPECLPVLLGVPSTTIPSVTSAGQFSTLKVLRVTLRECWPQPRSLIQQVWVRA